MTCALLHRILYQCASLLKSARVSVFFSFFRASVKRVLTVQYTNEILQREANVNTEKAYRIIFIFFLCWGEVRISFSFICFEHPFSPPLIRAHRLASKKKKNSPPPPRHRSMSGCVQSSIAFFISTAQTNKPHTSCFDKAHTTHNTKTKTKSKKMSQKSEQPPKAEEATPTHAHKHIDYSVRFSSFFLSLALARARAESLFNSKIALVFLVRHTPRPRIFLGALSPLSPSLSRARHRLVLCAGRWYK